MPTIEEIERAAEALRALLDVLPPGAPRQNALAHLDAVGIYAGQALTPPGPPETTDH